MCPDESAKCWQLDLCRWGLSANWPSKTDLDMDSKGWRHATFILLGCGHCIVKFFMAYIHFFNYKAWRDDLDTQFKDVSNNSHNLYPDMRLALFFNLFRTHAIVLSQLRFVFTIPRRYCEAYTNSNFSVDLIEKWGAGTGVKHQQMRSSVWSVYSHFDQGHVLQG